MSPYGLSPICVHKFLFKQFFSLTTSYNSPVPLVFLYSDDMNNGIEKNTLSTFVKSRLISFAGRYISEINITLYPSCIYFFNFSIFSSIPHIFLFSISISSSFNCAICALDSPLLYPITS